MVFPPLLGPIGLSILPDRGGGAPLLLRRIDGNLLVQTAGAAETVKLALIDPLTGPMAGAGQPAGHGAQLRAAGVRHEVGDVGADTQLRRTERQQGDRDDDPRCGYKPVHGPSSRRGVL